MEVSVKLVVFWHPEWAEYCSYCPELKCFMVREPSVEKVVSEFKNEFLLWELRNRLICSNLGRYGWKVDENSIIPPTFTDEEAVRLTEKSYERHIVDHQIIVVNVEVPKALQK